MSDVNIEIVEIEFDRDQATYREGDNVTGHVTLSCNVPQKVKSLRVELYGIAVVKWDGALFDVQIDPDEKLKGDCNREQFFNKKISLLTKDGCGEGGLLEEGTSVYKFECKLPPELPSSFEGQYGQILYLAKAYIEIASKKVSTVAKKTFTVISGLDLNFIPEAAVKIEYCKFKDVGGLCCGHGSVTIDFSVDKSGFIPGEDIVINGAVQNESRQPVLSSKVALNMVIDYSWRKKHKQEKHQIAQVEKGETGCGDITVWVETLHVPPVPPTGLNRSRIIDINYELVFTATFSGKETPVVYKKDIYIGTVSMSRREMKSCIAGMFNQPYNESTENLSGSKVANSKSQVSLTHIIAQAVSQEPTANPTAPDFEKGDEVVTGTIDRPYERDPPFAPNPPITPNPPFALNPSFAPSHPASDLYPSLVGVGCGPVGGNVDYKVAPI